MAIMSCQMDITSRSKASKGKGVRNCSTAKKAHYIKREGRYAPAPHKNDQRVSDQSKYNARKDQFADRHEDEIVFKGAGNMPKWPKTNPQENDQHYWDACDKYERANGRLSRNFILALPRELTDDQRYALTEGFIKSIAVTKDGQGLPFSFAIHQDKDNHNPHTHIMISERANDGINRNASTWFKRANPKTPKDGGARKTEDLKAISWLFGAREKWAAACNTALENAGSSERVDHRSYREQRIHKIPTVHVGVEKHMARKSHSEGVSTPSQRMDQNQKIAALNAAIEDYKALKIAAHEPKNGMARMANHALRHLHVQDQMSSAKFNHPPRLQPPRYIVKVPPMSRPITGGALDYVQRLVREIMRNQRNIWEIEIGMLNAENERLRREIERMAAEKERRIYEEIGQLQSNPLTVSRLLTHDITRDQLFKEIQFEQQHITHGDIEKVVTDLASTGMSPWDESIKIAQLFQDAAFKNGRVTPLAARSRPSTTLRKLTEKITPAPKPVHDPRKSPAFIDMNIPPKPPMPRI
jgi:MobA/MobL family